MGGQCTLISGRTVQTLSSDSADPDQWADSADHDQWVDSADPDQWADSADPDQWVDSADPDQSVPENPAPVQQIRWVLGDNFAYFSIKTYVVGTH